MAPLSSVYNPSLKYASNTLLFSRLWEIVCDAGRTLGGNTDIAERLVALINSVLMLPDVTNEHGITSAVRWRDLPELSITFRECGTGKLRTAW